MPISFQTGAPETSPARSWSPPPLWFACVLLLPGPLSWLGDWVQPLWEQSALAADLGRASDMKSGGSIIVLTPAPNFFQVFPSCELVGTVSSAIRVRAPQEVGKPFFSSALKALPCSQYWRDGIWKRPGCGWSAPVHIRTCSRPTIHPKDVPSYFSSSGVAGGELYS